ncbi:MAG: hypothetical protein LQ342_007732 [Letrouitia transgressa]|nr:MAG: hypothetical protein LQ342_007732 [Letrouitia transgressa]
MPPFKPQLPRLSSCLLSRPLSPVHAARRQFTRISPSPRRYPSLITTVSIVSASAAAYYLAANTFPNVPHPSRLLERLLPAPLLLDAPPTPVQTLIEATSPEEQVDTGNSTIPQFPNRIWLPYSSASSTSTKSRTLPFGTALPSNSTASGASSSGEEYTLLGLGIRKVSFLRIQVYVVGIYVATSSLPVLQESLIRSSTSSASPASTLVADEKSALREKLLSASPESEELWSRVLAGSSPGIKTALRITPTRATDFGHMREGWVRSILSRSSPAAGTLLGQPNLGVGLDESINAFKAIFGGGRKGVGKGKVLVMSRESAGQLNVYLEEEEEEEEKGEGAERKKKGGAETQAQAQAQAQEERTTRRPIKYLGGLEDERISRLVWLGYLAGKNVASEDARASVVDGVMGVVGRPIGTVETRVI